MALNMNREQNDIKKFAFRRSSGDRELTGCLVMSDSVPKVRL